MNMCPNTTVRITGKCMHINVCTPIPLFKLHVRGKAKNHAQGPRVGGPTWIVTWASSKITALLGDSGE